MDLIKQHPVALALTAAWLFSAAVASMPEPKSSASAFYIWAYNFLHLVVANLNRLVEKKYPELPLPPGSLQQTTTISQQTTATPPVKE